MEIRNSTLTNEKGLFSTKEYKKGEIIYILSGDIYNNPKRETIHIGNNKHIYDKYGIFINHSFKPNIYVNRCELIALCDIKMNDELLFNYNDTEINIVNTFYVNNILVCGNKT
jgi:hypothetical protein